jgi:hypothetical protein
MPIILAVEPDHKQAARLAAIVRHHVGAELVIGDTTERALDALGPRVPDMVLVPALLSPQDDASLAAAVRVIAAAAHVRTLTIPVLGSGKQQSASGGLLSRWRRGREESPEPHGCDPAVFAEQITAYLKEAAAERAEREDYPASALSGIADRPHPVRDTRDIVATAQAFEAPEPSAFESYTGAETFATDRFATDTFVTDTRAADTFAADTFADTFAPSETVGPAETFAATESFAAPRTLSAAERYAGAETYETATYDTTVPSDEQDANVDTASPALDLSSELGSLAPPANDQNLYEGEPFGTYTLPPFDEVRAEAAASLDASLPVRTPAIFDRPMTQSAAESPIDVDEPILLEEPIAFDEPFMLAEHVVFEPPSIFESIEFEAAESQAVFEPPVAIESPLAFQAPPVQESPKVVERAAAQPPPVEAPRAAASAPRSPTPVAAKPAAVVKAPVTFERPEVLELAAPVAMTPWRAWPPIEGVPIEVPGIAAVAKADVPDWKELMASLRQDMERRRTEEHRPPATRKPRSKAEKPAVDEWGLFDPEQCGFSALLAKLDEITTT